MAEQFKALTFTMEVRSLNPLLTSQTGVNTVYTRVQVEFFGRENGLKKST